MGNHSEWAYTQPYTIKVSHAYLSVVMMPAKRVADNLAASA